MDENKFNFIGVQTRLISLVSILSLTYYEVGLGGHIYTPTNSISLLSDQGQVTPQGLISWII